VKADGRQWYMSEREELPSELQCGEKRSRRHDLRDTKHVALARIIAGSQVAVRNLPLLSAVRV
jgi:hypothetical protein